MTYLPDVPVPSTPELMPAAITVFAADHRALERLFDAPWSRERRKRVSDLVQGWRQWLSGLEPANLCRSDQLDAALLSNLLDTEEVRLHLEEARFREMADVCPQAGALVDILDARRRLVDSAAKDLAGSLSGAASAMTDLKRQLDGAVASEPTPCPSASVANRLATLLTDLKKAVGEWHAFRAGYDPDFSWWTGSPHRDLDAALDGLADALRKRCAHADDQDAIVGDPVGREALMNDLRAALIPYTPDELIAIGSHETEWCRAEMLKASRDMGFGDDWQAALERIKGDHVRPGKQPELIRDLAREAVAFIEQNDLMTVPSLAPDGWHIEMMSAERQKVNPFFLGGEAIIVSYPTDAMDHEHKLMSMRGNNRHFARATVQHELIPGHFMQHFCGERYRPYRRVFGTPFWTEGWTLYWELRLWDLGFPRTPEERIGMLFWRMHRCARIVFSLRFHMGEMSPQQCVDMLVEDVGHERATAEGEVRRSFGGDYPPLYQCAYMIGGLQMKALHREMVLNGPMTERSFHDAVMRENCMPIAMLRTALRGDPIAPSAPLEWRFAD